MLDRYYQAAREAGADIVIRVTGDCPLVDPALVELVLECYRAGGVDYASNTCPPTFPDGLDVEVFSFAALERAWQEATAAHDREHVTPYLRESGKFLMANVAHATDLSQARWTVDEAEDLKVIRSVFAAFAPRTDFSWLDVVDLMDRTPDLFQSNQQIKRNEGAELGPGQKLWKRAKHVIPGGNMLLSKRSRNVPARALAGLFQPRPRAARCGIWTAIRYIDMSHHGHRHQHPGLRAPGSR